ncbi:MAG: ABC transporter ATP-binding protein [Clostridiales bacterium]|nr:ABC transporter ATP-binding protein [Clostridiales bacterium]
MNMIQTIDLTKRFGDFTANDHINLSVEKQEIKCIVGENGAGKSTLMNMLYGLLEPTEGKILIAGKEVKLKSPIDAIAHGIGMVHQHFKLVPSLTVYENIMLGIEENRGKSFLIDKKTEIEKVRELIKKYNFELDPLDRIEDISVGSRQRVEILKMLYRNVDILILDEPTAVLTPQEADELIASLKELKKRGKTIIVITHKLREVMEVSDSVTVIKHGKVVGGTRTADTNEQELAQMMVGRDVMLTVENDREETPQHDVIYEAQGITTLNVFGKECVSDVSFQVRQGEVLGIAGVEGNGQSELVKIISGLMETTKGRIIFKGEDITNQWPKKLREKGIGIIPEDRFAQGLCREMSIGDNCIAGYQGDPGVCRGGILSRRKINQKRDRAVRDFDIRVGDIDGNVASLSGGNAQKIIIARELDAKPSLLLACQPTRGVDIGSIEFIHSQILKYRNAGNAVILVSSELPEIMSLSDRVLVMHKGKISGEIDPKSVDMMRVGLLMAGISKEEETEK